MWAFNPVALIYFFAAGISFLLAFLSWKMRPAKGATYFSFMMLAVGIWVSAYVLELFNTVFWWKVLFLKIGYSGMAVAIFTWIIFVAIYTQYDSWLNKWVLLIMSIVPLFCIVNVVIAPSPNLMHSGYHVVVVNGMSVINSTYGGGFYLWTSYAYSTMIGGLLLMVLRLVNMPRSQRNQIYLFVPAIFIIIIFNVFYILRHNFIAPYDPTPLAMSVAGILFLISLHRHKLLEVLPVAHSQVFKNMKSAVVVVDSRDKIQEINPAAEQVFDIRNNEVVGLDVVGLVPECCDILAEEDRTVYRKEIEIKHIDQVFELKISPLFDTRDQYSGRVFLFFDITEKVNAINELDAYARTVAHDLKNPLNVILGHASLLDAACKQQGDEELCISLDGIQQGALHMNDIVESLLLLAKVRSVENVVKEKLNMQELLDSTLFQLNPMINEKQATVNIDSVIADTRGVAVWVAQVWSNLISNALKYGGDKPVITISSHNKDGMVYYMVKDTGNGLSAEQQNHVFVEFARMHKHNSDITGHGLGLPIVKRVVEKLGGSVGVESTIGEGSVFYFTLPAIKE